MILNSRLTHLLFSHKTVLDSREQRLRGRRGRRGLRGRRRGQVRDCPGGVLRGERGLRGHRAAVDGVGLGHGEAAAVGRRVRVQGGQGGGQEREGEGLDPPWGSLSLCYSLLLK